MTFENRQALHLEGLKGRLLSSSYVPDVGEPGHPEVLEAAGRLFEEHQAAGRVVLRYDTQVFFGPLSGPWDGKKAIGVGRKTGRCRADRTRPFEVLLVSDRAL